MNPIEFHIEEFTTNNSIDYIVGTFHDIDKKSYDFTLKIKFERTTASMAFDVVWDERKPPAENIDDVIIEQFLTLN